MFSGILGVTSKTRECDGLEASILDELKNITLISRLRNTTPVVTEGKNFLQCVTSIHPVMALLSASIMALTPSLRCLGVVTRVGVSKNF